MTLIRNDNDDNITNDNDSDDNDTDEEFPLHSNSRWVLENNVDDQNSITVSPTEGQLILDNKTSPEILWYCRLV
jgi:hypothetical protein